MRGRVRIIKPIDQQQHQQPNNSSAMDRRGEGRRGEGREDRKEKIIWGKIYQETQSKLTGAGGMIFSDSLGTCASLFSYSILSLSLFLSPFMSSKRFYVCVCLYIMCT